MMDDHRVMTVDIVGPTSDQVDCSTVHNAGRHTMIKGLSGVVIMAASTGLVMINPLLSIPVFILGFWMMMSTNWDDL